MSRSTKDFALELWDERYGKQTQRVEDFAGYLMDKGAYNNRDNPFGWNIHHKQPLSNGGQDHYLNIEITSIYINDFAADKIVFMVDNEEYRVIKIEKPEYGIKRSSDGKRVDYVYDYADEEEDDDWDD